MSREPVDIDALVAQAIAPASGCGVLQGDALGFANAVREKHKAGERVIQARVREILRREWDVRLSEEALRTHLNGGCGHD